MNRKYIPLYSAEQTAALDRMVIESGASNSSTLMKRAGACTFSALMSTWPETKRILVLCGTGNNGGDGYVIARLAKMRHLEVTLVQVGDSTNQSEASRAAREEMEQEGVVIEPFTNQSFEEYDVIVDALLGIGLKREVKAEWKDVILKINDSPANVVAVDIPSGLSANTGQILGAAVFADLTVTFMGRKQGMYTAEGKTCCGNTLRFDALDMPPKIYESQQSDVLLVNKLPKLAIFEPRLPNTHKGSFGHVLVIGGAPGMSGAVTMAATAALRSGAGLVSVATHPDHASTINSQQPEIMSHGILTNEELDNLIEKADIILIGPGLGLSDWGEQLFLHCIKVNKPIIVDADALRLLANNKIKADNLILTPHPGEAAMLLGKTTSEVQANRFKSCLEISTCYSGVAVLKGAGTLTSFGDKIYVNASGNPGMATAGMGDILCGIIAGLLAQGHYSSKDCHEICAAAVYVHGLAGDMVAEEHGERGMMATDLFSKIRKIINRRA